MRGIEAGASPSSPSRRRARATGRAEQRAARDDDIRPCSARSSTMTRCRARSRKSSEKKVRRQEGATSAGCGRHTDQGDREGHVCPSNVGVRILNGTSTSGLAAFASEQLTPENFEIRGIADSSQHVEDRRPLRPGAARRPPPSHMFPGARNPARPVGEVGCRADPRIGFHDVDDPELVCDAGHQDQRRAAARTQGRRQPAQRPGCHERRRRELRLGLTSCGSVPASPAPTRNR